LAGRYDGGVWYRIGASFAFLTAMLIIAAPIIFGIGLLFAIVGTMLGVALGASAGVIWIATKPTSA